MRRALSGFLLLILSLCPLAPALGAAGSDARLPACCRRNGAHHCAMSMVEAASMAAAASGTPVFSPPSTCPRFPRGAPFALSQFHALAARPLALPADFSQPHAQARAQATALFSPVRIHSGRAPPAAPSPTQNRT